jgi:uncharacterized protein YkwD
MPASGSMSADESHMIDLVNKDRANNGLKPLTFDSSLRACALAHSQHGSEQQLLACVPHAG